MEKMEKDQSPYVPVGRKPTTRGLIRYVDFQIMDLNSRTRRNIPGSCGKRQIILSKYDFATIIKFNFSQFYVKT